MSVVGEMVPVTELFPEFESFVGERESVREIVLVIFDNEERVRRRRPRVGEDLPSFLDPFEEELDFIDAVRDRELSAVLGGEVDPVIEFLEDAGFCGVGERSS